MLFSREKPWYHGSPRRLTMLRAGSTITQDKELARIFSHKPAIVIGDESNEHWKHTGPFAQGFLYRVVGGITGRDIEAVPHSSLSSGLEWNTKIEFPLGLVSETNIIKEELLTRPELLEMAGQGLVDMRTFNTILENQQLPE
jgi:hypothetical protein